MMQRNLVYIIGGVVVLGVVGFFGVRALNGGHVQQNFNGSQTYSNNEGSVTVGSKASMPDNWPNDVPANYAGATIVYSGNSNPQTGRAGAAVSYTVRGGSVQVIADYYKAGLVASGWTINGTSNIGGQMIVAATKEGRTFGVLVAGSEEVVTVTAGLELQ